MKEITVIFHSAKELWEFACLVNRQLFSVYIKYEEKLLDARSVFTLSALGPMRPVTLCLDPSADIASFSPYCVEAREEKVG